MFHVYLLCETIGDEKSLFHDSWPLSIIVFAFPINRLFLLEPSSVPFLFMACVAVGCYFKISSVCAAGG